MKKKEKKNMLVISDRQTMTIRVIIKRENLSKNNETKKNKKKKRRNVNELTFN